MLALFLAELSGIEAGNIWQQLRWEWSALFLAFVYSLLLFVVFVVCYHLPFHSIQHIKLRLQESTAPFLTNRNVTSIFIIAALAGVGEELFFRFFLQTALAQATEIWFALLLSNLIFGLAHCLTPAYALFAGTLGLFLGYIYHHSANLLLPILVHSLYDFWALYYCMKKAPQL